MKRSLYLLVVVAFTSIFNSCGGGDTSISAIDLIPVRSGKDFQYIDKEGKIVINPQFTNATVFRDGLALVETTGDESKYGFVTDDGKYAINAQYQQATVFSDGLAWVVLENGAPTAIDKKGEIKFTLQDAEEVHLFKSGLAAYSILNAEGDEIWGFVDKSGKTVINPQFSAVANFSDGLCGVRNNAGKWGFIDKEGSIILNNQFDGVDDFSNGQCVVSSNNKYGVIDKDGKYTINPQFTAILLDGDMFLVNQDGKWGWCDNEGKLIINPQFARAYPFNGSSVTPVKSGENYGYIDREGKIVINAQFEDALPFNGDLALVVSGNKIGFISDDGKYVINPQYDGVSKDLVTYFLTGGSDYSIVKTDYFNIAAITSIVNFESPEGFTFKSTFKNVIEKYKLSESDFSVYSKEKEIFSDKQITSDATYDFYVKGENFETEGWSRVFNSSKTPTGYAYVISLKGKARGKEEQILAELQTKIEADGFKKDESRNGVYSSDNIRVVMVNKKGSITIVIEAYEDSPEYDYD